MRKCQEFFSVDPKAPCVEAARSSTSDNAPPHDALQLTLRCKDCLGIRGTVNCSVGFERVVCNDYKRDSGTWYCTSTCGFCHAFCYYKDVSGISVLKFNFRHRVPVCRKV